MTPPAPSPAEVLHRMPGPGRGPEVGAWLARDAARLGLRLVVLSGSRMTGCLHAGSDLDLARPGAQSRRADPLELPGAPSRALPAKRVAAVDRLQTAPLPRAPRAERGVPPHAADERERPRFQMRAMKEFDDAQRLERDRRARGVKRFLSEPGPRSPVRRSVSQSARPEAKE